MGIIFEENQNEIYLRSQFCKKLQRLQRLNMKSGIQAVNFIIYCVIENQK